MTDELIAAALRAMGRTADAPGEPLAGSLSGSRVHRIRLDTGPAVVKVTAAGPGVAASRRELHCYRELSDRLPVALPRLLGWADTPELTAVLIAAHEPATPAARWTQPEWLELAEQLATLHDTSVRLGTEPEHWLDGVLTADRGRRMAAYWQQAIGSAARDLLRRPEPLAAAVRNAPASFLHGDCHVGNLLRDTEGRLLWADWQGVAVGPGMADLTFAWTRAESAGGSPPRAAMLERYARTRGLDVPATRRAAVAAELGTYLFTFPEYAHWNTAEGCDRVARQVLRLIGDWAPMS